MLTLITFLVGLGLVWWVKRFLTELPERLPKLLEALGQILLRSAIKLGWWLITTILDRAHRTLQYLSTTESVRLWKHRALTTARTIIARLKQEP
jgi:hypothetical protein